MSDDKPRRRMMGSDTRANLPRVATAAPASAFDHADTPTDGVVRVTIEDRTAPIDLCAVKDPAVAAAVRSLEGSRDRLRAALGKHGDAVMMLDKSTGSAIAGHEGRISDLEEYRGDFASHAAFREETIETLADKFGRSGNNGAFSKIAERVTRIELGRRTLRAAAITAVLGAGSVVWWAARTAENLDVRLQNTEAEILRLRASISKGPTP